LYSLPDLGVFLVQVFSAAQEAIVYAVVVVEHALVYLLLLEDFEVVLELTKLVEHLDVVVRGIF
jgi:hypothetical protein